MRKEKHIFTKKVKGVTYITVRLYYRQNGQQTTYTKTFNSKDFTTPGAAMAAACQHRDEMMIRLKTFGLPSARSTSLTVLMDRKEEVYPRSAETNRKHRINFNKYIAPLYGDTDIDQITAADISKTLAAMTIDCSADLIKQVLSLWRLICRTAMRCGMITVDPSALVEAPKSYKVIEHRAVLTDRRTIESMIEALGRHAKHSDRSRYNYHLYQLAIRVMYHTGLRPSECYALARSDIDLVNHTVTVAKRVGSTPEAYNVLVPPKTEMSARTVPITEAACAVLRELIETTYSDQLFLDYDGKLLNSNVVANVVSRVAKAEGIDFRMYMLRHGYDNDLLSAGVDPRSIMELMGHTEWNTTIGYARSTMEKKAEIIAEREESQKKSQKNMSDLQKMA